MNKINTPLKDCFVLEPKIFNDERGKLIKIFNSVMFQKLGLEDKFDEEYYSISKLNVLRGLHFQKPPHDHVKCVTCIKGRILDFVVDLRPGSFSYKQSFSIVLDSEIGNILYVPKGLAHGFLSLTNDSIFLNRTSTVYNASHELGINWKSINVDLPKEIKPIVSSKDESLPGLEEFSTPFID